MKDTPVTSIINRHTTVVSNIEAIPSIEGGYIHNLDQHNATLVLPSFRRNPNLDAKYDPNVDKWLRVMFGDRHAQAEAWIGYALAFEEGPTCAISIVGGQGVGKKMLTVGLSECLENPYLASGDDLTGQWQYGLLKSPFLLVNEGWPTERQGKHPADRFRELVSGDPIMVNQKYASPIACRNAMRIIFTANNLDVIKMLAGKRDLTEEDREALAVRLLHFDVGNDSARWLRANGGVEFTKGWISSGDGARDSDYRVARHFLHLYEKRHQFVRGPRLLVEGTGSDEMILLMQTETGSAPQIIEILTIMVQNPARYKGLVVDDENGEAYVTVSSIVQYWRDHYAAATNSRKDLDPSAVRKVLTGITLPIDTESETFQGIFSDARHSAYAGVDWHRLDLTKLIHAAQRFAWPMETLRRLVQKAKKHRMVQEVKNDH